MEDEVEEDEEKEREVLLFLDPEAQEQYDNEMLALLRKRAGKSQEQVRYENLFYEVKRQGAETRMTLLTIPKWEGSDAASNFEFERGDMVAKARAKRNFI